MWSQDYYLRLLGFAARAHAGQCVAGTELPYVLHPVCVAMEIMAVAEADGLRVDLAIACALLHDTLEDTPVTYEELSAGFGREVADGVQALSKDEALPRPSQLQDSLERIRLQPREVWAVKLADRITNLQAPPPHWTSEKIRSYAQEAELILRMLGEASQPLAERLKTRITNYERYWSG